MPNKIFLRVGAWYRATDKYLSRDLELTEIINDPNLESPSAVGGGGQTTPTLAEVLERDSDAGGHGIGNIPAISFKPGVENFLYLHSDDGTPWIVKIANNGTLSVVNDS